MLANLNGVGALQPAPSTTRPSQAQPSQGPSATQPSPQSRFKPRARKKVPVRSSVTWWPPAEPLRLEVLPTVDPSSTAREGADPIILHFNRSGSVQVDPTVPHSCGTERVQLEPTVEGVRSHQWSLLPPSPQTTEQVQPKRRRLCRVLPSLFPTPEKVKPQRRKGSLPSNCLPALHPPPLCPSTPRRSNRRSAPCTVTSATIGPLSDSSCPAPSFGELD